MVTVSLNSFADTFQKWCKRIGYHFSYTDAERIHAIVKRSVAAFPKNDSTKLLIAPPFDSSIAIVLSYTTDCLLDVVACLLKPIIRRIHIVFMYSHCPNATFFSKLKKLKKYKHKLNGTLNLLSCHTAIQIRQFRSTDCPNNLCCYRVLF